MRQSQNSSETNDTYSYSRYFQQIFVVLGVLLLSLGSNFAVAAVAPICPVGDQMYYYGATPPPDAITPPNLSWADRDTSNSYTVNDITFKLEFTEIDFLLQGYPKFGTEAGVTTNAINMYHTSQKKDINHKLTASINRPISKYGFIVQDLDSNLRGRYIESLSLVTNGGIFSNYRTNYFKFTDSNKTISGVGSPNWTNCGSTSCNFNVDWNGSSNAPLTTNTPFVVTHGNIYENASPTGSTGNHLMGYSDFYFCLTPPKLTVKKILNGTRVKNTGNNLDQFEIVVTGDSLAPNSRITAGTGSVIDSGTDTTNVLQLKESTTYTITERVLNGSSLGDISNYNASYKCTNATTGSTTTMPTSAMNYNSTNQTRSFTLENVTYSDNISCIITNTPKDYTFTGFVFNDNGGIANTDPQNISSFINVNNYFNGSFEPSTESGIFNTSLKVRLTDCSVNGGTNIPGTSAQSVSDVAATRGQYKFSVPASALANRSNVCLVQVEPNPWNDYTVDTTPNEYKIMLKSGVFDYKTGVQDATNNILNLDFGEVIQNQSALVLKKYQYVHDCNANLNYRDASLNRIDIAEPTDGFSKNAANKIEPGRCIAYKIEAYNRGHIALTNIKITDNLQERTATQPESTFALPAAKLIINNTETNLPNENRKIVSTLFDLPNTSTTTAPVTLYFNTKYGTTNSPNT